MDVFVSEVHGMAQRGGSVNCTVRIGKVSGPLVANGTADAIVSTEPIEALRYIYYSNKKTKIITDTTNNRLMRAVGGGATDAWWVVDGSASVTPA